MPQWQTLERLALASPVRLFGGMRAPRILSRIGLVAVLFGSAAAATATPAQIIFLRHAEKPATGAELNARGWERAQALVALFTKDRRVQEHGLAAIYAGAPAKAGGSVRSIQTIQAAGQALGIVVDTHITRDEIDALVRAVMTSPAADGKTVIVCWEHKKIPEMVQAFGWTSGPKKWDDAVFFDRGLWLLDFDQGRAGPLLCDRPQKLLPGDSEK